MHHFGFKQHGLISTNLALKIRFC